MKEEIKKLKSYVPEEPVAVVKERYGLDRLVRLSANENPFGTSPKVKEAVVNWTFSESNRYPDGYATKLRQAVSERLGLPEEQLVFGVGLDEILELLSRTFLEKGDEILVADPTFSEYALHAQIEGARVIKVPVKPTDGHYDFERALTKISSKTKLIWLCNPNNPTGVYERSSQIAAFIKQVPATCLVLIDEAYIEYVTDEKPATSLDLLNDYDNVAVLRTFSKVYGLANYRVGYIVMAPKLAEYMQTVRLPYNLNSVAQVAAEAALADQTFVADSVAKTVEGREYLEEFLTNKQIKHFHSQANFVYLKYPAALELAQKLLENGYQVRTGLQLDWLRITIGELADVKAICALIAEDLN